MEKGTNNLEVRNTNKKRIINLLYHRNEMTKQDISKTLELSLPTVSQILKELFDRGLVRDGVTLASSGGRKPVANTLAYDAKLSAGIEITQNNIRFVLIDLAGNALYHRRLREQFTNSEEYFKKLGKLTEEFLTENFVDKDKLLGAGIAVPGIVQRQKGILEFIPTLGVKNLPISRLTQYIPYQVEVDNEANLAGFAAYCSTMVLTNNEFKDTDNFFEALEKGNEQCINRWETYLDYLATGINNIKMIFDTDIIIGGDIDEYLEKHMNQLMEKLYSRNSFGDKTNYIHISKYGGMASAVGAALMLVDNFNIWVFRKVSISRRNLKNAIKLKPRTVN